MLPRRRTGPWCSPELSAWIHLPLTTPGRKLLCVRQRKLLRESGPVLPPLGTAILPVWAGTIEGFELYLDSHDGSALEAAPAERTVSPFSLPGQLCFPLSQGTSGSHQLTHPRAEREEEGCLLGRLLAATNERQTEEWLPTPTGPPTPKFRFDSNTIEISH